MQNHKVVLPKRNTQRSADCIVVGSGIIGLMTAWELVREGLRVVVLERQKIGRESSWAGGGILFPLFPWDYPEYVIQLASYSWKQYRDLVDELREISAIDAELIQSGMTILDEKEMPQAISWAAEHHWKVEILPNAKEGVLLPEVCQIRNPNLIKALVKTLLYLGVSIETYCNVEEIQYQKDQIFGVRTKQKTYSCDTVIIACGAWSNLLTKNMKRSLPVRPVRGQMLLYFSPTKLFTSILVANSHYLIPRKDGHILVGSTIEEVGFNKETTDFAREKLAKTASDLIPRLKNLPIKRHWAGLRPGSPAPIICNDLEINGLYIHTGHFRNGILLAPASSKLLADILLQRPSIFNPAPFQLGISEN